MARGGPLAPKARRESDAYAVAWDVLLDRRKEGVAVFLSAADWVGDGVRFEFTSELERGDGSTAVRKGVGRREVVPGGKEEASVIVTAPMEDWKGVEEVCRGVLDSLVVGL